MHRSGVFKCSCTHARTHACMFMRCHPCGRALEGRGSCTCLHLPVLTAPANTSPFFNAGFDFQLFTCKTTHLAVHLHRRRLLAVLLLLLLLLLALGARRRCRRRVCRRLFLFLCLAPLLALPLALPLLCGSAHGWARTAAMAAGGENMFQAWPMLRLATCTAACAPAHSQPGKRANAPTSSGGHPPPSSSSFRALRCSATSSRMSRRTSVASSSRPAQRSVQQTV